MGATLGESCDGLGESCDGLLAKRDGLGVSFDGLGVSFDGLGVSLDGLGVSPDGLGDIADGCGELPDGLSPRKVSIRFDSEGRRFEGSVSFDEGGEVESDGGGTGGVRSALILRSSVREHGDSSWSVPHELG